MRPLDWEFADFRNRLLVSLFVSFVHAFKPSASVSVASFFVSFFPSARFSFGKEIGNEGELAVDKVSNPAPKFFGHKSSYFRTDINHVVFPSFIDPPFPRISRGNRGGFQHKFFQPISVAVFSVLALRLLANAIRLIAFHYLLLSVSFGGGRGGVRQKCIPTSFHWDAEKLTWFVMALLTEATLSVSAYALLRSAVVRFGGHISCSCFAASFAAWMKLSRHASRAATRDSKSEGFKGLRESNVRRQKTKEMSGLQSLLGPAQEPCSHRPPSLRSTRKTPGKPPRSVIGSMPTYSHSFIGWSWYCSRSCGPTSAGQSPNPNSFAFSTICVIVGYFASISSSLTFTCIRLIVSFFLE